MGISVTPIPRLTVLTAPAFTLGTVNTAGSAITAVASDSTLLTFDGTTPAAVSGTGAVGSAVVAARRDHVHASTSGAITTVDNNIARYAGTAGALQGYTSGGPTISDTGTMVAAAQPTFGAVSRTAQDNCTGNNTIADINFDTELWDVGGNFSSHVFTAPVAGKYLLRAQVQANQITTSANNIACKIWTSNRIWIIWGTPGIVPSQCTLAGAVVADMDESDQAKVQLQVNGEGSDIVDIQADAGAPSTSFSGWLLG